MRVKVARSGGFEPPTPRFVVWCSIQLSYERARRGARRRPRGGPYPNRPAPASVLGWGDQLRSSFAKSSQKKAPRIGSVTARMIVDSEKMIGTCDWCEAVMVQL